VPGWINLVFLSCLVAAIVLGLLVIIIVLRYTIGFPFSSESQSFGGGISPEICVLIMFLAVIGGIMATYVFNLNTMFSWQEFVRPIVVSPLILLPLIGSVQGASLEPLQLICFTILAFQNGFFWQQVLRDAKPRT
jgi:hypothetical protein